jgi:hypothetical protein
MENITLDPTEAELTELLTAMAADYAPSLFAIYGIHREFPLNSALIGWALDFGEDGVWAVLPSSNTQFTTSTPQSLHRLLSRRGPVQLIPIGSADHHPVDPD